MALVNHAKREINAKIVYAGPSLSGKSTMLQFLYRKLKPELRGNLKSMKLQNDKMIFFDFFPARQQSVEGYSVKFHIYTISGNVSNESSWKMVLKGADGVIFVADSSPDRMSANLESLKYLNECLSTYDISGIPRILICNKRDLADSLTLDEMRIALAADDIPLFQAVASKGEGVLEGIFNMVKRVLKRFAEDMPEAGQDISVVQEQTNTRKTDEIQQEPAQSLQMTEASITDEPEEGGVTDTAFLSSRLSETSIDNRLQTASPGEIRFAESPELIGDGKTMRISLLMDMAGKEQRIDLTINLSLAANPGHG